MTVIHTHEWDLSHEAKLWLHMLPAYTWRWSKRRSLITFDNDMDAAFFKLTYNK